MLSGTNITFENVGSVLKMHSREKDRDRKKDRIIAANKREIIFKAKLFL